MEIQRGNDVNKKRGFLLIVLIFLVAVPLLIFKLIIHHPTFKPLVQIEDKSRPILITNVSIFTGDPDEAIQNNRYIYISEGRIARIGSRPMVTSNALIINAKGKTVIPGLIDAHVHIMMSGAPLDMPVIPDPERNLSAFLYAGVTSVIDMGGVLNNLEEMSRSLNDRKLIGPRLIYAGPLLTEKGGHPAALMRDNIFWPLCEYLISSMAVEITPDINIDEVISNSKAHGALMTKVVKDDIPFDVPELNTDTLKNITAISQMHGLPVVAHIGSEDDINDCLDAGIRYFAHAPSVSSISDETIARMKEKGAVVTATLTVFDNMARMIKGELAISDLDKEIADPVIMAEFFKDMSRNASKDMIAWGLELVKYQNIKFNNVKRMKQAGIPIIAATDSPNMAIFAGSSLHRELELLVTRCGFSPQEALAAATSVPAKYYSHMLDDPGIGYIVEGGPADLVILRDDFRDDIQNTASIDTIIQRGCVIKRLTPE